MNFEKLKDSARKFEQKEDWRRAIEVYLKAIQEFESGHDPAPDLSIYNRVGDLYLKANEPGAAVQAYERAADLYRDQGFLNNAIALCGKILRVNPGRIQTYLKLAHLHARKNVVIEAKKNLLEYLERMNALGQLDEAFKAMKDFADQFPGNKEIRLMLSELLRASSRNEEAKEQLEKLASDLEARGDTIGARKTLARLQAIESGEGPAPAPMPKKQDLIFLDTGVEVPALTPPRPAGPVRNTPPPRARSTVRTSIPLIETPGEEAASVLDFGEPAVEPLEIETSAVGDAPITIEPLQPISDEASLEMSSLDVGKALGFEPTGVDTSGVDSIAPLEGLEIDAPSEPVQLGSDLEAIDTVESQAELAVEHSATADLVLAGPDGDEYTLGSPNLLDLPDGPTDDTTAVMDDLALDLEGEAAPPLAGTDVPLGLDLIETGVSEPEAPVAVPFLQVDEPTLPSIAELEERVFDDPDDPETHRALGEALLASGEAARGADELDLALVAYEGREDWQHAIDLVNELIRLDPNAVGYHQKRVELAYRTGDKARLIDAYLELGDALMRAGALDKALAVYSRVAEHDPGNRRAGAALETLAPVEEAPPPAEAAQPPAAQPSARSRPSGGAGKSPPPSPETPAEPRRAAAATPPPPDTSFIDLGALILEEDRPRDPRMKVEDEEPTGDEQRDFDDMLMQFKRGIDENIDAEDFQSHYDLGVAFKEMGLLDEAIAEFQKALRAPEGRLRTSEALGVAFFEKGQFAIAEAILKRAVESLGATDDEQIGLIYWLGRATEAQGKLPAAVACYERILAVDIGFQDTGARMAQLAARRGQ